MQAALLAELNFFWRGGLKDRFALVSGAIGASGVEYGITLDPGTELRRDPAWQLVGAMTPPLHRVRFGEDKQRVWEGCGILEPRLAVSLPGPTGRGATLRDGAGAAQARLAQAVRWSKWTREKLINRKI
jgi:hypothetical protein